MNEQAEFLYGRASRTLIIITVLVIFVIVTAIVLLPFYAGLPPDAEVKSHTRAGEALGPIPPPAEIPADVAPPQ